MLSTQTACRALVPALAGKYISVGSKPVWLTEQITVQREPNEESK